MFEAANIRGWRGHQVVDTEGHKIGELEAVHVDTGTDLPSFATVKVGMPTRHRLVFVPLARRPWARVPQGLLRQETSEGCPSIGTDGQLPAGGEEVTFKHYGLAYQPAPAVSGGWPAAEQPN